MWRMASKTAAVASMAARSTTSVGVSFHMFGREEEAVNGGERRQTARRCNGDAWDVWSKRKARRGGAAAAMVKLPLRCCRWRRGGRLLAVTAPLPQLALPTHDGAVTWSGSPHVCTCHSPIIYLRVISPPPSMSRALDATWGVQETQSVLWDTVY